VLPNTIPLDTTQQQPDHAAKAAKRHGPHTELGIVELKLTFLKRIALDFYKH
jgi:hypothetical protein